MIVKKAVGKLHLWLGMISGLLVFIISITGALYAFQEELQDLTQPYRFVEERQQEMLPPSKLKTIAQRNLPGKEIHAVAYFGKARAAQVIFYHYEPSYYDIVFMNPYDGEVLNVKDMNTDFFRLVLMGHFYLWLPPAIGQPLVASATLVFVFMLISGIVLWWPKNKSAAKQRFSIKWNAKWRRKNYDLHNVLGFYACVFALVFAITGLVWGFQWFAQGLYTAAGGKKSLAYYDPVSSDSSFVEQAALPAIDRIWLHMRQQYPLAKELEVHVPETDSSSIAANVNEEEGTHWKMTYHYFDQYSLKELPVDHIYGNFKHADFADKLMRLNYDIHVGSIWGFPGKCLAFLASLVAASLPLTGIFIWWGRRKKSKQKCKQVPVTSKLLNTV